MMQTDYQLTLQDYWGIALRRRRWVVGAFLLVLVLAATAAFLVPPVYESTGVIMVESQQIPVDLVQASVTSYADERIETIKQRVMTRDNLLRIAKKYQLYADASSSMTPSDMIDDMRDRAQVELINANVQARQRATIAFKVSFDYQRAVQAQLVANELVTLFLNENVKARTERANQTTEFLTKEADKLRADLDALQSRIATYKLEHGVGLTDNVALTMTSLQRMNDELRAAERDQRAAQDELRALEVELASAKAGIGGNGGDTPQQELLKARAELTRISATYTENHPDVRALRRTIDGLEKRVMADAAAEKSVGTSIVSSSDLAVARLEARQTSVRSQAEILVRQQAGLRAKIAQIEGQMARAPQVEQGLSAMLRDLEAGQRKYEEIRAKQMSAQVSESLEEDQKAERFSLLEPPTLPERPIKPNRKKMLLMGLLSALAAGAGVVLYESMYGHVSGVEVVASITGHTPLIVIPYIAVAHERQKRRRSYLWAALVVVGVVAAVAAAVHFLYWPLDVLLTKWLLKLG